MQSPSGEQIEHKLQELIPPELADKMKNQLLKTPHNQYRHEAGIMEAIRSGDVQQVKNAFKVPLGGSIGILAPDPLRSLKNHANLMNVLASRVAISAGVSSEEAFSLSDKFFFAAENCRTQAEAWQLREDIAAAFALQIKSYRDRLQQGESHLVRKARELMHQAVFSKSSIAEIAAQAGCSPDHLEVLFKATCGLTLRQYQLKVKLDTAKELLLHSDCTVGDIASLLHFASASHFCSAFSRQEGFTPLQYRNHNR